jgi:hypothetical protein
MQSVLKATKMYRSVQPSDVRVDEVHPVLVKGQRQLLGAFLQRVLFPVVDR